MQKGGLKGNRGGEGEREVGGGVWREGGGIGSVKLEEEEEKGEGA